MSPRPRPSSPGARPPASPTAPPSPPRTPPRTATQWNAPASVPGTLTYAPIAGTVVNAGTRTLSVPFAPTDSANSAAATKRVSIIVGQGTPVITWSAPAGITYGSALGMTQLNATASVPGTLTYDPIAGTVLNAGTRTLSVAFAPTDALNYSTASKTASTDARP